MIVSLTLDPDDSADFPGNTGTALGRPIPAYPLLAARAAGLIQHHFVVTASPAVKSAALQNDAIIVDPPPGDHPSCPSKALLAHGWTKIKEDLKGDKEPIELVAILFAHAPAINGELVADAIEALRAKPELDSVVSVTSRNHFNPYFARRLTDGGLLEAYVKAAPEPHGEVFYPNWDVQLVRAAQLDAPTGEPPFPWFGRNVLPLKQWGGGPVDYKWQVPGIEYWLKKHGYSDLTPSFEMQPKPQPKAQPDRR